MSSKPLLLPSSIELKFSLALWYINNSSTRLLIPQKFQLSRDPREIIKKKHETSNQNQISIMRIDFGRKSGILSMAQIMAYCLRSLDSTRQ